MLGDCDEVERVFACCNVWRGGIVCLWSMFCSTDFTGKGLTLRLRRARSRSAVDATPSLHAPQFGGYCAMSMSIGKVEKADVKTWSIVDGHLVVQRNEKAVKMWGMNPQENRKKAEMMWPKVNAKANKKG